MNKISCLIILGLSPFIGLAQQKADSSKTSFNFFNPTPKYLMRDFETDRPDVTESAYTVDAGHFQAETDLFKTERINYKKVETVDNYYNFINLKLGLTNKTDIQLVISPFVTSNLKTGNIVSKTNGFGNITLRIKQNLWGNDGGKTALAIMPFINFPKQSQKLSGGVILPFATSLSNNWGFGVQIQTDFVEDQLSNKYHFNYLASATLSHPLCKKTNFFFETFVTQETEIELFEYFFNGGLIYEINNHVKADLGFNYGFKTISPKVYFIGISFRY